METTHNGYQISGSCCHQSISLTFSEDELVADVEAENEKNRAESTYDFKDAMQSAKEAFAVVEEIEEEINDRRQEDEKNLFEALRQAKEQCRFSMEKVEEEIVAPKKLEFFAGSYQ